MNDRDFITSLRDQCNTQLGTVVVPPVVVPPTGGGGGTTPPPGYTGSVVFEMGSPGEKSPTDLKQTLYAGTAYALRFNKTSEGNTMRLMGSPAWHSGVTYHIEGRPDLGERSSGANGGYSDLDHSGAAGGEVVIHFVLASPTWGGTIAPQLF